MCKCVFVSGITKEIAILVPELLFIIVSKTISAYILHINKVSFIILANKYKNSVGTSAIFT